MRPIVLFASLVLMTCRVAPLDPTRRLCGGAQNVCPEPFICVQVVGGDGGVCLKPESVCEPQVPPCEKSVGVCASKGRACLATGHETLCTAASYGADYEPVETRCDGKDNDCDGATDESEDGGVLYGGPCELDAGVCAGARRVCVGGSYEAPCTAASYGARFAAVGDACDGLDNDCDGRADVSRPVELAGQGPRELFQGGGLWAWLQAPAQAELRRLSLTFSEEPISFPLPGASGRIALLAFSEGIATAQWNGLGADVQLSARLLRADGGMGAGIMLSTVRAPGLQQLGLGGTATSAAVIWALSVDGGAQAFGEAFSFTPGPPLMGTQTLVPLASVPTSLAVAAHDGGYVMAFALRASLVVARYNAQLTQGAVIDEQPLGSQLEGLRLIAGDPVAATWRELDGVQLAPDVSALGTRLALGPLRSWAVARSSDGGLLLVTSDDAGVTLRVNGSSVLLAPPPMGAVAVAPTAEGTAVAWSVDGGTWSATALCQ